MDYLLIIVVQLMQADEKHLLQVVYAKQNAQLQEIKKQFSQFTKYFFNMRTSTTIAYDKSILYVIHKDCLKIIDLGKVFAITDLVYNYQKHIAVFLTTEGHLYLHFAASKTQMQIKKDFKKILVMEWIYSVQQIANLFVAEEGGVHLYRLQQDRKSIKQVKHVSGKYHCFLYQPVHQFLVGFQYGYCDAAFIYEFNNSKAKSWFRSGQIDVNFTQDDQVMAQRIREKKSIGLEGSRISKEVFASKKHSAQDYFIDIQHINNTPYLFFYYSNEGKLKLTPLDQSDKTQVVIKLPSDSIPSFNIVDNMLVVHLKNQRITFIYDINALDFQALVSPFPLAHEDSSLNSAIYKNQFIGKRILDPMGRISKWKVTVPVIYHYLKSQMHIFQFLNRRSNTKMELIKWMRSNIFTFKQINLSKMWKLMFAKIKSNLYDESEMVSILQIYSNLFYTLYIEPLISKDALVNILLECIRQAHQFRVQLPDELQALLFQLLLDTQKYDLLAYLAHHLILTPNEKVFKLIYNKGLAQDNDLLISLSVDLGNQWMPAKQVLRMIMKSQRLRQGKRFIKNNFEKMEVLDFLEAAKYIERSEMKREFVAYVRLFINVKFPNTNQMYLDEAQQRLFA